MVEQCAWALGNVAGEAEDLRDWLLRQGALSALARNLSSPIITLVRTAAWALSNLIKVIFFYNTPIVLCSEGQTFSVLMVVVVL